MNANEILKESNLQLIKEDLGISSRIIFESGINLYSELMAVQKSHHLHGSALLARNANGTKGLWDLRDTITGNRQAVTLFREHMNVNFSHQ